MSHIHMTSSSGHSHTGLRGKAMLRTMMVLCISGEKTSHRLSVVSLHTYLTITQVPDVHPYGLLLLYLPCMDSVGLMDCGRPYGMLSP